jgi:hypothetical protein
MKSTPDAEIIGKLAEISENVDRGNLTPARRRELIRQFVALLQEHDELLKGLSAHHGPKVDRLGRKGAHRPKSPTAHAAEKFGVGRSTVKRALAEPRKAPEPITDHSGVPADDDGKWRRRKFAACRL